MTQYSRPTFDWHQLPVTFLLLVTSAASIVTCLGTSSTPFKATRKSRLMPIDFRPQYYTQLYQVEKLKAQILRSLNLTTEPEPPTKKPPQPITSIINHLKPHNHTRNRPAVPDAIVWSEPVDRKKRMADQLLFRVNNQRKKSAVINRVTLILRLRSKQHSKRKQRAKVKPGKRSKDSTTGVSGRGGEVQSDEGKNSKGGKNSKSRRKKKGGRSRRKKSRRVKVLVQALNERSGKFKRVAVQRFNVDRKFRWIKLPIPASLVSRAAESINQTLVLRVRCKRCYKGRVSIDSVLPRKKSRAPADENSADTYLSLNPNRPYLVIRTADKPLATETPPSPPRSARHVDGLCSGPSQSDASTSCCAQRVHVSFKALGWDQWIVHPKGFTTVLCGGVCAHASPSGRKRSSSAREVPSRGQKGSSDGQRLAADGQSVLAAVGRRLGDRAKGDTGDVYTGAGPRETQACLPSDLSPLEVMYYTDQNTLVRTVLPDVVSRSCGCSLKGLQR